MPYIIEKKNPQVGFVNDAPVRRDEDGDYYLDLNHDDDPDHRFYITVRRLYTLDNCIAQLRAACQDPKDRVIAAARAVVAAGYCEDDCDALAEALEALDGSAGE